VPYFDKKGRLVKYVEKPKNPPHDFAIPGIYFFDKNIFKCFKGKGKIKPSPRGEYEIVSPFNWLIKHGYRVDALEYKGGWLDPGKFDDWIEANQYLLDMNSNGEIKSRIDKKTQMHGRVTVGGRCKIRNSEIRGPVMVGSGVSIKNSYVGPYTSIGDNCEICDSHVENSVLMNGVKILNVKQPINESLIGARAEIVNEDGPTDWLKLFIGEKSKVII
jgi:glucose-1-phosphate thymidylyltransferase